MYARKKKTSISVSPQLLKLIDTLPHKPPRSTVIEEALILYFKDRKKLSREKSDLEILNANSDHLNVEALEILQFQAS